MAKDPRHKPQDPANHSSPGHSHHLQLSVNASRGCFSSWPPNSVPPTGLPGLPVLPFCPDPAPYQGDEVMIPPLNQEDEGRTCHCLSFPTGVSTQVRQQGDGSTKNAESQGTTAKPCSPGGGSPAWLLPTRTPAEMSQVPSHFKPA